MWTEMKREEKERANRRKEKCTEAIEKEGKGKWGKTEFCLSQEGSVVERRGGWRENSKGKRARI